MEIDVKKKQNVAQIDLAGRLLLDSGAQLKETIGGLLEENIVNFVINLEQVDLIDSSGLGSIVASLRRVMKHSGSIKLAKTQPHVRMLMEMTGLNKLFEIYDTPQDAIAAFGAS